jgi:CBS-domain-containing membrane protein
MRSRQIRRIPVVDADHHLLGILSLADIVKHAQRLGLRATDELAPSEISATLATICQPRGSALESATI